VASEGSLAAGSSVENDFRTDLTRPRRSGTMSRVRLAVAGAGLIGHAHIERVVADGAVELSAIVDPGPAGPPLAEKYEVPLYASLGELFAADKPDGVILATPNQLHVAGGLECIAAGVPVVVEKPIADSVEGGRS
jgi:predicted dehydrogenase